MHKVDKATKHTVTAYTETAAKTARDLAALARKVSSAAARAAKLTHDLDKDDEHQAELTDAMRRLGSRFGDLNRLLKIRHAYQRHGFDGARSRVLELGEHDT